MAFDKKAYNRAYYEAHKDLWRERYGDAYTGNRMPVTNRATIGNAAEKAKRLMISRAGGQDATGYYDARNLTSYVSNNYAKKNMGGAAARLAGRMASNAGPNTHTSDSYRANAQRRENTKRLANKYFAENVGKKNMAGAAARGLANKINSNDQTRQNAMAKYAAKNAGKKNMAGSVARSIANSEGRMKMKSTPEIASKYFAENVGKKNMAGAVARSAAKATTKKKETYGSTQHRNKKKVQRVLKSVIKRLFG